MRTFKNQAAQGDTFYRRVKSIPKDAKLVTTKKGAPVVVAHSETGHDHVFRDATGCKLYTTSDPFICYLRCETESMLEHLRQDHTHEAILFAPGCYEIRRQREHTPEGYKMVVD